MSCIARSKKPPHGAGQRAKRANAHRHRWIVLASSAGPNSGRLRKWLPIIRIFRALRVGQGSGAAMSALGQKRTLGHVRAMSALPPKADIGTQPRDVRFVPITDVVGSSRRQKKKGTAMPSPSVKSPVRHNCNQPPPPPMCSRSIWSFSKGTGLSGCCKSGTRSVEAPPTYLVTFGYLMIDLSKSMIAG
jgi:hypothetical protein